MTHFLTELLQPQRLTAVVDIGANPIDGDPPYLSMLRAGLCSVTGFEPQPEALQELQAQAGPLETYLPYAVGDGREHTLYQCRASGMTSLLRPDPARLAQFNVFSELGEITGESRLATRRLDEIDEISALDFLKIDVQGSELSVFEHGTQRLSSAVAVQTEISFMPLYEEQPALWQVDRALRELGLVPHAFAALKRWPLAPFVQDGDERKPLNQLLEADLVYVRDFTDAAQMQPEQLKQLALLAQEVFQSSDLVYRCLQHLSALGAISSNAPEHYLDHLGNGRPPPPEDDLPVPLGF